MNREIKFRAWDGKSMHYNVCINHNQEAIKFGYRATDWVKEAKAGTPMQYTGLKDKNGKEIYEGDVVECQMSFNGGYLPHMGEIVYVERLGSFATKNQAGETLLHNHLLSSFEIIGNIHENHDLLNA